MGRLDVGHVQHLVAVEIGDPGGGEPAKGLADMGGGGKLGESIPDHAVDRQRSARVEAGLDDQDLVLGMVRDGQAMAWPIRYLAMYEVVNSKAGKKPVAPTW